MEIKSIVVAFTLKGQDFNRISYVLEDLSKTLGPDTILIHGFMPRKEVVKRNFPTDVVDALDKFFPIQLNMYGTDGPMREHMAEVASRLGSTVYVIGERIHGVAEEAELYMQAGLAIMTKIIQ